MPPATPLCPAPLEDTCVPFAQASPAQQSQALLYLQTALRGHFPALGWAAWAHALWQAQPDLWVDGDGASLDYADLARLTQDLAGAAEPHTLDPPIYGPRSHYLAKRLLNYRDEAVDALAELEADPRACGPRVYALVTDLAVGNSVAEEVFRATAGHLPLGRPPGSVPGKRAPAAPPVHARVLALERARGSLLDPWAAAAYLARVPPEPR